MFWYQKKNEQKLDQKKLAMNWWLLNSTAGYPWGM